MVDHILMIISSLGLGGAQRVLSHMADYWAKRKKKISLITLYGHQEKTIIHLNPDVNLIQLNINGISKNILAGLYNNKKRIIVLNERIKEEKPKVIISFLDTTNILVLLAAVHTDVPVIVTEMSDPSQVPLPWPWRILRKMTYYRAQGIVVVTEKAKDYFPLVLHKKITTIPNPIVLNKNPIPFNGFIPSPMILYAGRLAEEKRIDILLKAFYFIKDKYPTWHIGIVGDGPLRQSLEKLRDELRLQDRVHFFGLVECPHYFMKKADMFVLCSQYEGFPVALVEAMANGLPVIASEYHYGVRDIIEDGINGLIVPPADIQSLSRAMDHLMCNKEERIRMGQKAVEISEKYSIDRVMEMWDGLLNQVVSKRDR